MSELYHHGILGQRWGVRRFQKKDGSLTSAGKSRYADEIVRIRNTAKTDEDKDTKLRELDEKVAAEKEWKQKELNLAKKEDTYLLDFLEVVQNYKIPKNVKIKEYEKYIDSGYTEYLESGFRDRLKKYEE